MPDGDPLIQETLSWAPIVPEFLVSDLAKSVDVYTNEFGFTRTHSEHGRLAVLALGAGQLVLRQAGPDDPPIEHTGLQLLHLRLADPRPLYERLRAAKFPIQTAMETSELRMGESTWTETSFVVADPDGYLLRFAD